MIIMLLFVIQLDLNGNQECSKLSSFCCTTIHKFGEFTNQPPSAEEWTPSSALPFKREEVVAYEIN